MNSKVLLPLLAWALPLLAADQDVGFIEKYALAPDRDAVLQQLVPGTEDYFYFHALRFQETGRAELLHKLLGDWARQFPDSPKRAVIQNRAALLGYDRDPQATIARLREVLSPDLTHEQVVPDRAPDLPTVLNPGLIAPGVFQAMVLESDDLGGVDEAALEALVREKAPLRPAQVRALLSRLSRPDVPGLLALVEQALGFPESRGFGEFPIHGALLPDQLDELAARRPALFGDPRFVLTRLRKLRPGPEVDLEFDLAERDAWLERTWAYVSRLSPAFSTLKAHLLFNRLELGRRRGVYDRALFLEYLKLPRRADYVSAEYLARPDVAGYAVDLKAQFEADLPALRVIGSDEWLVRDYLLHLLRDDTAWEPWAAWLRDTYVKPLFAEAKLTAGIGDPTQWAPLLTPDALQQLKNRVDVELAPTSPPFLAPADGTRLEVLLKNVPKLIVKIYELNALGFFLSERRQLNTDIDLAGLVATEETTHDLSGDATAANPFRRHSRTFDFPKLAGRRGAWIVEFIGGGKSSRALLRKGQWQLVQRIGPAGDVITVLDEKLQPVKDAAAWVDGRRLVADAESGGIVVPFTQKPGTRPIVLTDSTDAFATLAQFEHHGENYRLDAQFHLEREQLLAGREATVAVRAALRLGDGLLPLSLLREPTLRLTTQSLDGVSSTREIAIPQLDPARLFTQTFAVPDRTERVTVELSAAVERLSAGGERQPLSATRTFAVNGITRTPHLGDLHLSRIGEEFVIEALGRNGEALAGKVVAVEVRRRGFSQAVRVELSTDAQGRVKLGGLAGGSSISATLSGEVARTWRLDEGGALRPDALHARAGEVLRLPWTRPGGAPRSELSLLEVRGGTFAADHFDALRVADGFLEVKGLAAGEYSLFLRAEGRTIALRISPGVAVENWLVSPNRHLEQRGLAPVQITAVRAEPEALVLQLANVNAFTRVHVVASRFISPDQPLHALGGFERPAPVALIPSRRPNLFASGRAIGDEYRYVLERRFAKKFPGNLLTRPGLLLNPWDVRSTDLEAQTMAGAEALRRVEADREAQPAAPAPAAAAAAQKAADEAARDESPSLDFLANPAPAFYNLVPDAAGIVRLERKALGDRQQVQIFAEDLSSAAWRSLTLPLVPAQFRDLRLARPLDPARRFTERREATPLAAGQSLTMADPLTSELETYDSVGAIFTLLGALNPDPHLAKFSFIRDWPKMDETAKRAKYSEFACHELNFFLSRKDPAFFTAVVAPSLRNKRSRTFMDDYLLEVDLARYLEPWAHGRLNAVERCLLGHRIAAERAATARHLRELWELDPPKPEVEERFFTTALLGRALTRAEAGSFRSEVEKMALETAAPAAAVADFVAPVAVPRAAKPAPTRSAMLKQQRAGGAVGALALVPAEAEKMLADSAAAERGRAAVRPYFRELGPTREWAENHYYRLPIQQQTAELVPVNGFWRDFAAWDGKGPFLSGRVVEAHRSFTEVMLALAVLDLPFEPGRHNTRTERGAFTLTAASPLLAFHRQLQPAAARAADDPAPELLVSENFFRVSDRYAMEGNEQSDRYVSDEFLAGELYGGIVVVSNPRSSAEKLTLLLQIPQGALPAQGSQATDRREIRVEPFSTARFEYYFYFPAANPAPFPHYPAQVSRSGVAAGNAKPQTFKVVKQLSAADTTSWNHISQAGSDDEVIAFLESHNLARLDLEQIAWRARRSAGFFQRVQSLLGKYHIFAEPIARYGLLHNDAAAIREWLKHQPEFLDRCGPWLASPLLTIDPEERRAYEHLEYLPLVNQRAHRLGAEPRLANPVLREQYRRLLGILAHRPALAPADELAVVYYLFVQDRIEEALVRFRRIDPARLTTRLQHDYFRCYAALYEEDFATARRVAAGYAQYPVDRWRRLFSEVTAQLDEAEGRIAARGAAVPGDRDGAQAELANTEPTFDFKVENRAIALAWANLAEVTIHFYPMDPELLFSASPFVTRDAARFAIVKPSQSLRQPLPADRATLAIPLPAEFSRSNVLIEILGAGQRRAQPYHANTLDLRVAENYGRLELREQAGGRPVSKAYVKVYAQLARGEVRFVKDGYTDLRGRFDYASLNSSAVPLPPPRPVERTGASGLDHQMLAPGELGQIQRFAILVLSDEHGAAVREVAPPSR